MYQALGAIAGAGLSAYGADKQRKAMASANQRYGQDLAAYHAREGADADYFRGQYQDIGDRRQARLGGALNEYMAQPYGQQAGDTATIDAALTQVGSGGNPGAGMGGAAQGWGTAVGQRTAAATGRQRLIAGDANQLRRQGEGQTRALQDQGIADQGFAREQARVQKLEQLRRAKLAQQLQALNANAQGTFDQAGRKGSDLMAIGGMLGAGGSVMDSFGGGGRPAGYSPALGYNPDLEDRGSYVVGWQ